MLALDQIAILYGKPMALLIQCCRVHFKTDSIESLNERIEKINEKEKERVLKGVQLLSRLHRIRPVVYRILLNANISIELKIALKNELHSITLQNFELAKETERIIKKLGMLGIVALPYKGVAFSKQFYGDISMRESSDIDLVIDKIDLHTIYSVLEEEGYTIRAEVKSPSKTNENYFTNNKDLCLDKITSNAQFHLELHWMITDPKYQAPAEINKIEIKEIVEDKLSGTHLKLLEPNEHFRAILLHHFLHDGIEYIKLIVDLAQAQTKISNDLASKKIIQLEQHYNIASIFTAIEALFGIEQIGKQQNNKLLTESIIEYCLHSTIGRYQRHRSWSLLRHYMQSLHNRVRFIKHKKDQRRFQFSYLYGLIKPGLGEQEWIPLPSYLHGLYYLIRPIRILLREKEK